jgi:CheY-like chemotaxis protein
MQTAPRMVLVVEDDEPTRALLAAIVTRNGMRAVPAADGQCALDLLRGASYDAVLLDLLLPLVSGLEILAYLFANTPDMLMRVVVVTAALEPAWMKRIEVKRARSVIRKPFDVYDLERAMLACCDERPR